MFVPVPILILIGLVFLLMTARILSTSRRTDPLLGSPKSVYQPETPAAPLTTLPPEIAEQVRALLAAGRKLEAVKIAREATRLGLQECKDLVEALA
ncbi:hypothetical protein EWE75_09105 [Sphingomonas populi]|uniref:Ribosomal protein L7/L12 C-terminal domain-containing protein n=1 Tax=Sphingomonas populi TaxID=2484750 RepID=A0A4Q6Y6D4_9SPHN|nr:hypothetical protein [Sphingomonas populi]RZF64766.1 hypothetical protein EWE75_09105 [Sphingomonas populi]